MTALRVRTRKVYECKDEDPECGWEWTAFTLPKRCAKCKRLNWNAKPGTTKRGRPAKGAK